MAPDVCIFDSLDPDIVVRPAAIVADQATRLSAAQINPRGTVTHQIATGPRRSHCLRYPYFVQAYCLVQAADDQTIPDINGYGYMDEARPSSLVSYRLLKPAGR